MKIDYTKIFNAWFCDVNLTPVPINQASKIQATTLPCIVEYDFSSIPDLSLSELTKKLLLLLPENFVFVKSMPELLSTSIEHLCQKLGRYDIKFIRPYMDIDKDWYNEYKDKIFFYQANHWHEAYTLWKLSTAGIYCGAVGQFIQLSDLSVVKKSVMDFHAAEPNWKVYHPISYVTYRLMSEKYNDKVIHPNFVLLLIKAFIKQIDLNKNWINYRMLTTNKIGATTLAISLAPFIEHNYNTIINPISYPKYPETIDPDSIQHPMTSVDSLLNE